MLEALSRLCRQPGREKFAAILRRYAPTWLVQMPWLITDADRDIVKRETLGAAKERMLRELCEALSVLTTDTPLVLVLEDLHWGDYSTIDLIAHLGRRRDPARLMVLGTYRPAEVNANQHPLKGVKQELQIHKRCRELALEFLNEAAVADYLRLRFANEAAPGLAALLHKRTDGNPLFLTNLTEYLLSQGVLSATGEWTSGAEIDAIGVPESLQQLIGKQIERLEDGQRRILEAASLAGVEFPAAAIAFALGLDPAAVEDQCAAICRRGLFLESASMQELPDGSFSEAYRFVHELYRHVLEQSIGMARRMQWHRQFVAYLEQTYGGRVPEVAVELAAHAEGGRDSSRAITYRMLSGEIAARRYANREAMEHLRRAAQWIDSLPDPERMAARVTLLDRQGRVRRAMEDTEGAIADFETLADLARALGQPGEEARALLQLSAVLFWKNHDRCLATVDRAVELTASLDDGGLQLQARGYRASRLLRLRGWTEQDYADFQRSLKAAREQGDRTILGLHLLSAPYLESFRSEYGLACESADEGMAVALELGDGYQYISCQYFKGWALLHAGRWGEALGLLRDARQRAALNGHQTAAALCQTVEAWLRVEAFDFAGARDLACAGDQQTGFARFLGLIVLGHANLGLGETEAAFDGFHEVRRLVEQGPFRLDWPYHFPLHDGLARLWLRQGEWESAGLEAARLLELAASSSERTYLARAHCLLAECAIGQGKLPAAAKELDAAAAIVHAGPVPLASWRVWQAAAQFAELSGRPEEASGYLRRRALEIEKLGASLDAEEPLKNFLQGGLTRTAAIS